jgi:hypothetical protein
VVNVCDDQGKVIDAATGNVVRSFPVVSSQAQSAFDRRVRSVAVSPADGAIAVAIDQSSVAVFDAAGRERRRFTAGDLTPPPDFNGWKFGERQRPQLVESVAFTPDGKWLVTGGEDMAVKVWEVATAKLVMRFDGSDSPVEQVAVSPDGRSAFAAGSDGFVARWGLTPPAVTGKSPDEFWAAAADPDPAAAAPAAWALADSHTEYVRAKMPPAAADVTDGQIDRWVADLGAAGFAVREAATKALADRGRLVAPQLRAGAKSSASAEGRRRAEDLLARLDAAYTPDELRTLRLVQACERLDRRELLARWAGGAAGAVLTEEAKAGISRKDAKTQK